MRRAILAAVLISGLVHTGAAGQRRTPGTGQRPELQLTLQQRYQLTVIGEGVLGLRGSPESIRQAGGVVILQREGLFGSRERRGAAGLNIGPGAQIEVSGKLDQAMRPGERFYVHSIYVGTDVVTFGLMTVQLPSTATGTSRLWANVNFFFSADVLERGDRAAVLAFVEQWLVPENMRPLEPAPASLAALPTTAAPGRASAPAGEAIQLQPGASIEQVAGALGAPLRRIEFGEKVWLYYPGLVLSFAAGKLADVDRIGGPPATVTLGSQPASAEIWLDGRLVGETPATLDAPAGAHKLTIRKTGHADWIRDVNFLAGSRVTFTAQLEKK